MKRTHVLAVSLLLAVAVVAGGFAAYQTAGLGSTSQAATTGSDAAVAAKEAQLDRLEQATQAALERRPPALPPLVQRGRPSTTAGTQVVYSETPVAPVAAGEDEGGYEGEHDDGYEQKGGDDD